MPEVQNNVQNFRKVYNELLKECIERRHLAGVSQQFLADWLEVDRRKIIALEKGNGGVGLLLNYADKFDIVTKFEFKGF